MIEEKIEQLGIKLNVPPAPAGSYVPVVVAGNFAYVSGQIPIEDGKLAFTGKVTDDTIETGQKSARLCVINILSQLKKELGDLERIQKFVRLNGFVNAGPDFSAHPKVINGASDLLFEIFGEKGKHSRIAVGVSNLPLNSMTEIDAVVQIN
ncbi:RidA family protein [Nitrosopumilus sp. K4]|uniref:RidA family protein n=1 Tax=Nitrosopumilus sp. K4 TaxID=2795383 RepID=UPI001BA4F297|nr:RidA family protein [Nitrosopumilus sp. K4]QUC65631.1 RidA family protein [Nitrosopumilus sp. K4]